MKTKEEWTKVYHRHCQTVWNICYPYFMNSADTEDAVQETFLRLIRSGKVFRDEDHEKAWLIVTAKNACRDEMKRARRKDVPLEMAAELHSPQTPEDKTLLVIQALPEKQRTVIYLYYYEDEYAMSNKSLSLVEVLAEKNSTTSQVRFLQVFIDDSGNNLFKYLEKYNIK